MATIIFNETQKAAIVSLLIEMINADHVVDPCERDVFNTICVELGVDKDTFSLGRSLDSMVAVSLMRRMNDLQKLETVRLLTRVIDADAKDDDKEIRLLNVICVSTGVDVLINSLVADDEL